MNSAGEPGDVLVLTKPLGTGILTTALKRDLLTESELDPAVQSMTTLNDGAMRAALTAGVRCATDITGFGLLGHLKNVVTASGVGADIAIETLPLLPRALGLAAQGVVPGGTARNRAAAIVTWADDITEAERMLACDAQTSGGLLLAVAPAKLDVLLAALAAEHAPAHAVIGRLTKDSGDMRVVRSL